MGKIVIHAGMWKTGSTSIQWWLGRYGRKLRESGIVVLKTTVDDAGEVRTEVHPEGVMHSNAYGRYWGSHPKERRRIESEWFAQLDHHARSHPTVVLSGEALSRPFWMLDEPFLHGLDELAGTHDVHVAYYVRPQHTALEAAWREAGFQRHVSPAKFLENHSRLFHYHDTYVFVRHAAPRLSFVPRPFRRDMLLEGNVVADFAHDFLGLPPSEDMTVWENRGFSLDVVNALSSAPTGLLWDSPGDNTAPERAERLVDDLDIAASETARISRLVLQQACHARFEQENRRLITELEWDTEALVPPVADDIGEASFERLDDLWRPRANVAERALLYGTLARLLQYEAQHGPGQPDVPGRRGPDASPRRRRVVRRLSRRIRRSLTR